MKEVSVEDKLKQLYALQNVDSQLQEIGELKGDLPQIVEDLEARFNETKAKIKDLTNFIKQSKAERDNADVEIITLAEKIEKYKDQQLKVKSNKQYDALTREIEAAEAHIERLEKEMASIEGKMENAKKDIDTFTEQSLEVGKEFDEKKKELREVNKEHEKEELRLRHEREKLVVRIDKGDIDRYERIRKAKAGQAVVPIRRGACGGCFNRVPPQKILEIRQNSRIYTCESCGRILISDKVAESATVALS
jgi:predicted  nucleic acid-binding Zn-ribbon protein